MIPVLDLTSHTLDDNNIYLFVIYLLKYNYTGCIHISKEAVLKIYALSYIQ